MAGHRRFKLEHAPGEPLQIHPKAFVFLDKQTGTPRFQVRAGANGRLPADQAAHLLAMHCLVRGQAPKDFDVVVSAGEDLIGCVARRAQKLIHTCLASATPVHLSTRQQEVLRGVLHNLTNKEIAAKLNLTERTVKFHISSLLHKFDVGGRVSLMQKTAHFFSTATIPSPKALRVAPRVEKRGGPAEQTNLDRKLLRMAATERGGR